MHYSHRLMCLLAHGEAPSNSHQAAHSCGRGQDGCVNPQHLSWKTNGENQLDRRSHGTKNKGLGRWGRKLMPAQVQEIRSLKGKMTQDQIAKMFGIGRRNVGAILSGKTWTGRDRRPRAFTSNELTEIRQAAGLVSQRELAQIYGVGETTIQRIMSGSFKGSIVPEPAVR